MAGPAEQQEPSRKTAPLYNVPTARVVALEHPAIIRNLDNGIKSFGGEAQLKHVLEHHVGDSKLSKTKQNALPEPVAGISLRPNDPFAKKISSTGVETRNVLVKITLPKRTGRKRKRGSDEPFTEPAQPEPTDPSPKALHLLQRLRDNEGKYTIQPVGMLHETHRFRTLPDFQLRNADLPIMKELRDHVMVPDYDKLKEFNIDLSSIPPNTITAFPGPPTFTSIDMPHKYEYQQAASVVVFQDENGYISTKNISAPPKRLVWELAPDAKEVPQGPPIALPKRSPGGETLPRAIAELEKLLKDRPLITKRVALNSIPPISDTIFKEATQFVGYSFKAGPFRDCLIKYGVDPRTDPKYRIYQTMMFQIDNVAFKHVQGIRKTPAKAPTEHLTHWARPLRHTRDDPATHIFDGIHVNVNGKTWQICDVTDPVLEELFRTENLPTECDVYQWGWYHSGTMAKGRAIMKDKMRLLFAGETPPEEVYKSVIKIPDVLHKGNINQLGQLDAKVYGRHASDIALDVRNLVKAGEGLKGAKAKWQKITSAAADGGSPKEDDVDLREIDAGTDDENDDEGQGDFADMDDAAGSRADGDGNESGGSDDDG